MMSLWAAPIRSWMAARLRRRQRWRSRMRAVWGGFREPEFRSGLMRIDLFVRPYGAVSVKSSKRG